jgi:hypothetical protein
MGKRFTQRTQGLQGLANSLDTVSSEGLSASLETRNRRENRRVSWRSRLPVKPLGLLDESIELVVLPRGDTSQLLRFMGQLDERLLDADNYGSILRTVYLWDGSIIITILMESTKIGNLVVKLSIMPEVEKVEEELPAGSILSGTAEKSMGLSVSGVRSGKRICVTLKEPVPVRRERELVPALA